jgi:succinyl-CoA synthetase alpha subunit
MPTVDARTQIGGMGRRIRIVPGSRGAMTPGDPGMTAGASARLPGFAPGLLARKGRVEILAKSGTGVFDFFKLNDRGLGSELGSVDSTLI